MIDRTRLLNLMGGDKNIMGKLINSFRILIENHAKEMVSFLDKNERELLSNHAHVLKTQSDYMGLDQMKLLAEKLEHDANSKTHADQLRLIIDKLVQEINKVKKIEGW